MNIYSIPNLGAACKILKTIVVQNKGFSVSEIARDHDLPRTTVLRIVKTLVHEDFLREEAKLYYPGTGILHLGLTVLNNIDIRNISQDVLTDLTLTTGETSHLAVRMGNKSMLLEVCESPHPVKVSSKAGSLAFLHCSATGKVFIAYMEKTLLAEFCRKNKLEKRTANTLTTFHKLNHEIDKILKQGYAFDDEEYHPQVRCLAAPIQDAYGNVVAAIGITATVTRFPDEKLPFFAKSVKESARRISNKLGYKEESKMIA